MSGQGPSRKTPETAPEETGKQRGAESSPVGKSPRQESEVREIGGREGPDPTRYGDWEKNGRCIDF